MASLSFRNILLVAGVLALATALTPPAYADHYNDRTDGVELKRKARPFLVKMNAGDPDRTIAENGDLRVFVRCEGFTGSVQVRTIGTSASSFAGPFNLGSLWAGGTEVVLSESVAPLGFLLFARDIDQGSFVQNGSHYIAIDGETQSQGLNIFGFDCFTAGTVVTIREELDD